MIRAIDRFRESRAALLLRSYFLGLWYPVTVAALVGLGHLFAIEMLLAIPSVLLLVLALVVCDSARPCIPFVVTFVYQVSVKNAPGLPNFSDYYFTSWRLVAIIILAVLLICGIVYFILKNKIFRGMSLRGTPLLIPLLLLSLAFTLGGAFSGDWTVSDLVYGVAQAAAYTLLFLFFYFGLRRERGEELLRYFTYVSAVTAVLLAVEVFALYAGGSVIVDGSAVKDNLLFGWGIWNTAGVALATLIPLCFLGAMRSRFSAAYFAIAVVDMLAVILTLSRNSILFGAIAFLISLVVLCVKGRYVKAYRITVLVGALLVALAAVLMWDRISVLIADLIERGLSDNGRYELWQIGIDNFRRAPVFGIGFFGFVSDTFVTADFLPNMAHQTVVQLLSATGIFGLLAYLFYRVCTLVPFLKKPSVDKLMLLGSVLVMLCESMLDNFIFYFLPVLHYTVAIAIAFIMYENESEGACEIKSARLVNREAE